MALPPIHIGTSGWHYKHWLGNFYPSGFKPAQMLPHYLQYFRTVEINNSFYKLPSAETFAAWRAATPPDFLFAVKGSRFISHMKKLKEPHLHLQRFLGNVEALQEKLGPILFQLPPLWNYNEQRLADFLAALPKTHRFAIEFRNPTWYNEQVYQLLRQYNVAFCIYEIEYHMSPVLETANWVYVRLHGPGLKYQGSYSESALAWWANQLLQWQQQGKETFIYFDNDQNGYAAFNAIRLQELVQEKLTSR